MNLVYVFTVNNRKGWSGSTTAIIDSCLSLLGLLLLLQKENYPGNGYPHY